MHAPGALPLLLAVFLALVSGAAPPDGGHTHIQRTHHTSTTAPPARRCSPRRRTRPTTNTAAAPAAAPSPNASTPLAALFPLARPLASWTTSPHLPAARPLSAATLRPHHALPGAGPRYAPAPDGAPALHALYPAGSYGFTHAAPRGGFSFYAPGPAAVDLTAAKEATFGYAVYFPADFEFRAGGKLPGLYGGDSAAESLGCSGGRRSPRCFSARLMWRARGAGELYTYLPPYDLPAFAANARVCGVAPRSVCNPVYGASVGRGAWAFARGARTYVSQRVRLNDVGAANGAVEVWAGGRSVVNVSGLVLRDGAEGRIRGVQMQTFFGGATPEYASPQTQSAYFSDFSVAITELL